MFVGFESNWGVYAKHIIAYQNVDKLDDKIFSKNQNIILWNLASWPTYQKLIKTLKL